jgi:protein CpxP
MTKKQFFIAGMVALLALGSVASGCRHHSTPEEKMDRVIEYLTDDMNLTGEQIEMLDKLKGDLILEIEDIHTVKKGAHDIIISQIKSDVMDQQQVMSAIDSVRTEIDDAIAVAVSRLADFHQTLTPEQKAQLIEQLDDLKKLHGCRH